MHFRKILSILFLFVMLAQPFSTLAIQEHDTNCGYIDNQTLPDLGNVFGTNAAGGEDPLKENVIDDSTFAHADSYGGPSNFYYYGSSYAIANASYQDITHAGSYSGYTASKGTPQQSSNAYQSPAMPSTFLLNYTVTLDFWYNPYTNPDFSSGGQIYLACQFYTGINWRNINYYFSRNSPLSLNDTNNGHYDMRNGLNTWLHFDRNITSDYEDSIGPVTPTTEFRSIYFYVTSPVAPTAFTELIIDDVSLTNDTGHELLQNGDFEMGDSTGWSDYRRGPSFATITYDDSTDGNSALNLSTSGYFDDSYSNIECAKNLYSWGSMYSKGYQTVEPGDLTINFDWKYSDVTNGGINQYARFYIYASNGSFDYTLHFYLGHYADIVAAGNSTGSNYIRRYYASDGFGTRDTWNHFSLDLFELSVAENIVGIPIRNVGYTVYSGRNSNSTTQVLIDNFDLTTYPTGDPSFELDFDWHPTDPVISWINEGNHQYTNITTDTHSGNYAANISSYNSYGQSHIYRNVYLPIENNLYADFWWKLDSITSLHNEYSMITILLNNSYSVIYILGKSETTNFYNNSNNVYYYVENNNSTGTWNNLVRNIASDAVDYFGNSDWIITRINCESYSENVGGKVITLVDDIHFVRDTTPPEISSVTRQNEPTYYDNVIIEISAQDLLNPITEVILQYRSNSTWFPILTNKFDETTYLAEIPNFEYGTVIEYFVEVADIVGNSITDDNSGSYYSYSITDDIDPTLSIFGPTENESLIGQVVFYINSYDIGSDITDLTIEIGTTELYNGISLEDYTLDTTLYDDGNYTLTFIVEDGAGNTVLVEKDITIDNPEPPKQFLVVLGNLFNWGTLVGAGVIGLGFGIFFLVRFIKLRKAA